MTVGLAGLVGGGALFLWATYHGSNEIYLHGFSPSCADGSDLYDPRHCGVIWRPGLPYVAAALGALSLTALAVWNRWYTSGLLVVGGATAVVVALGTLALTTWFPANPRFPEPAGPQVLLLVIGIMAAGLGVRLAWVRLPAEPSLTDPQAPMPIRS